MFDYLTIVKGLFILLPVSYVSLLTLWSKMSKEKKMTSIERTKISSNWESFVKESNATQSNKPKKVTQHSNKSPSKWKNQTERRIKNILNQNNNLKPKTLYANQVNKTAGNAMLKNNDKEARLTHLVAMDCEMVGIGEKATDSMLARVSIVNKFGDCIYDTFVQPREPVTDYRTPVSGVRKEDLANGQSFEVVQKRVSEILDGRVLIGHGIKHDLEVLFLSHPMHKIRDTSRYKPFRELRNGGTPSLKLLTKEFLQVDIQSGEHSSVEDARAVMQIYCNHAHQWENSIKMRKSSRKPTKYVKRDANHLST